MIMSYVSDDVLTTLLAEQEEAELVVDEKFPSETSEISEQAALEAQATEESSVKEIGDKEEQDAEAKDSAITSPGIFDQEAE
jgi:hypothetical protein